MKIRYVIALTLSLLVSGCDNAPKFDGSSQESLRYSGEKVVESLSDANKEELKSAILDTLSYYDTQAIINNDGSYSSDKMRLVILNGKTAEQIISEADSYREKKEQLLKKHQLN